MTGILNVILYKCGKLATFALLALCTLVIFSESIILMSPSTSETSISISKPIRAITLPTEGACSTIQGDKKNSGICAVVSLNATVVINQTSAQGNVFTIKVIQVVRGVKSITYSISFSANNVQCQFFSVSSTINGKLYTVYLQRLNRETFIVTNVIVH